MEELFGFAIFAIIMVASILSKIQEQKKAAREQELTKAKRVQAEQLPEATRQVLYGGTDVPVAKPKTGGTPVQRNEYQPKVARPAAGKPVPYPPPVRPQAQPQPRPVTPRRNVPAQPASVPAQSLRERVQEVRVQMQQALEQASMPTDAPPQRPKQVTIPAPQPRQRQAAPPPVSAPYPPRAKRPQPVQQHAVRDGEWDGEGPRPRSVRSLPSASEPQGKRHQGGLAAMLRDMNGVRSGIVLGEILGPPKAFR
jgi:hypothetical protein